MEVKLQNLLNWQIYQSCWEKERFLAHVRLAEEVVADFNSNLLIIKLFIFYGYHFVYQIKRSPHKAGKCSLIVELDTRPK